jgi:small subunit ribosomal protein S8
MITDPIADMLTRLRNAQMKNLKKVEIPYSNIKKAILEVLRTEKYIADFNVFKQTEGHKMINIDLKPEGIEEIRRVSKSSRRVYLKSTEIKNYRGISIISTSRGVMSSAEARKKKLGGEVICQVN